MTVFEFVFSLYSLLFGLALAQVFGGFGRVLQERHKIRVGCLTPLLGLFVTFDITSFWEIAWQMQKGMDMTRPYFLYLICGVLLAGIYYLAATLVVPRNFDEWPDFDEYYFRHKQLVLGGVLFCNIVAAAVTTMAGTPFLRLPIGFANDLIYLLLVAALIAVRNKRANIVMLALLLAKFAIIPLLILQGIGVHGRLF
ncbi:MAG: hypothetical protein ACTHKE_01305 [Sphingomicrobium sp.]|jgi:hypothetical protein